MRVITGEVDASYSQVELHPGVGAWVHGPVDLGLASDEHGDAVTLVVPREYGTVRAEIQIAEEAPPVEPDWDAVVEWSLRTGDGVALTGWAGAGLIQVPVPADVELRVRYVVLGGQEESDGWHSPGSPTGQDRYLLQLWPAPPAPPQVVRATVPWSQYWVVGQSAAETVTALSHVPDPARLAAVVDEALRRHPDVLGHLRAGDGRYRSAVVRYLQELFRVTYADPVYADLRHDADAVERVIADRVAAAG